MYQTPEERLNIGRRVFTQEISKEQAASEYNISITTVVNYVKEYMKANKISIVPKVDTSEIIETPDYSTMSKEEIINEIMKKDIEVARAKKGYTVKGGGKTKEYNILSDANTKQFLNYQLDGLLKLYVKQCQ